MKSCTPAFFVFLIFAYPAISWSDALKRDLAAEKLGCPLGSELIGEPPPQGREVYCGRVFKGSKPVRHGPFITYYRHGQKKVSGNFHQGKRDGLITQYYANGNTKETAHYTDGILDGERVRLFSSGQIAEKEFYKEGKLHGRKETYDFEGKPKFDGHYVEGNPEGPLLAWYPNGQQKHSGFIKNSKKNGTWTSFYLNGEKRSVSGFREGKLHGSAINFRRDGTVKSEMLYEEGKVVKSYRGGAPKEKTHKAVGLDGLKERDAEKFRSYQKNSRRALQSQKAEYSYRPRDPKELERWERARAAKQTSLDRQAASRSRRAKMHADASSSSLTGLFDVSGSKSRGR